MLVTNFMNSCADYENFAIWEVESMNAFLNGNGVFAEMFKADYKMTISEFDNRRSEIEETNMEIMKNLLDHVGDKHFLLFTPLDQNHMELVMMQDNKIMNFGMDINSVNKENVYVVIMDKKG